MFWGVEQERALDREKPKVKAQAVTVKVDLNLPIVKWSSERLGNGIRALLAGGDRCDVEMEVNGQAFAAHQVMLASVSKAFRTFLAQLRIVDTSVQTAENPMCSILSVSQPPATTADELAAAPAAAAASAAPLEVSAAAVPAATADVAATGEAPPAAGVEAAVPIAVTENAHAAAIDSVPQQPQRLKLQVSGITRPEAMQILLSYVYEVGTGMPFKYKPSCLEVDKDVLHLARHFELNQLHEYAARWLIQGLSTHNVVERLVVCEEFQLGNLREKMMEQLASIPDALGIVCSSPDIMKHPKIMQDLLKSVAFATKQKQPEQKIEEKAPEKIKQVDLKTEKEEKPVKEDKAVKDEKIVKVEKVLKEEKVIKVEKFDKGVKTDKIEKVEKIEKVAEKQDRPSAEKPPPAKKARRAGTV